MVVVLFKETIMDLGIWVSVIFSGIILFAIVIFLLFIFAERIIIILRLWRKENTKIAIKYRRWLKIKRAARLRQKNLRKDLNKNC